MQKVRVSPGRRVDCVTVIEVPLPASAVWGQMRDLRTFATLDPFHREIEFAGRLPARGTRLRIVHGVGPIRLVRVGRVLRWSDGLGYTFSDLSARGPRSGFPHVYEYAVHVRTPESARLSVRVRGRWTATRMPRALVWLWLSGVVLMITAILRIELYALYRRRKRQPRLGPAERAPPA